MKAWIAGWVFVFACGMLIACMAGKEDRRKNLGVAGLMVVVMLISGYIVAYR